MKQKQPKCTFCGDKIVGEVAYLKCEPYHGRCLTREKYRIKAIETDKKMAEWYKMIRRRSK